MLNVFSRAVVAGLFTVLVAFGIPVAQAADPTTTAFALSDDDKDGVVLCPTPFRHNFLEIFQLRTGLEPAAYY